MLHCSVQGCKRKAVHEVDGQWVCDVCAHFIATINPMIISRGVQITTEPSREYFVRQAVLNWLGENFAIGLKRDGVAQTLKWLVEFAWAPAGLPSAYFVAGVRKHYRRLKDSWAQLRADEIEAGSGKAMR